MAGVDDDIVALANAAFIASRSASKSGDHRAARLRELAGETMDMADGFERPAPVFRSRRSVPAQAGVA
ncbi:hypothetical protein [Roseinatronobacter sp. NSM]|uniref:hypothetical protein n=1 Tax=Roseinatronobacter sp. NSM TaxID=3457785 RepID=UPI0040366234